MSVSLRKMYGLADDTRTAGKSAWRDAWSPGPTGTCRLTLGGLTSEGLGNFEETQAQFEESRQYQFIFGR